MAPQSQPPHPHAHAEGHTEGEGTRRSSRGFAWVLLISLALHGVAALSPNELWQPRTHTLQPKQATPVEIALLAPPAPPPPPAVVPPPPPPPPPPKPKRVRRRRRRPPPPPAPVPAPAPTPQPQKAPPTPAPPTPAPRPRPSAMELANLRDSYGAKVHNLVQSLIRYPRRAKRRGLEGTAYAQVTIDQAGRVQNVTLVGRKPHRLLQQAALELVRQASPLPQPPTQLGAPLTLRVPIAYRLD